MSLTKFLSTAFRKDKDSNVCKLLKIIENRFNSLENTAENIRSSHWVNFAQGKSLDYIASLFNLLRLKDESDDEFRARIKIKLSKIKESATINEIKEITAAVLNTTTMRVQIKDDPPANFEMKVWLQDLNNAGITAEQLKSLLKAIKPAGVSTSIFGLGTFTYRSAYETSDPAKAYNDLNNSNPQAGTYSGWFGLI